MSGKCHGLIGLLVGSFGRVETCLGHVSATGNMGTQEARRSPFVFCNLSEMFQRFIPVLALENVPEEEIPWQVYP